MKLAYLILLIPTLLFNTTKENKTANTFKPEYNVKYAVANNLEDSIQLLITEINNSLKNYAVEKGTYINCSNYGMIWGNHVSGYDLLKTTAIPAYSNTVKSDGYIALIDNFATNGFYTIKFRKPSKTSNSTILKITDKKSAIQVYNNIILLKSLSKRSVEKSFGTFQKIKDYTGQQFINLRNQYRNDVVEFLSYKLSSAIDKKTECKYDIIAKEVNFYYKANEKKYWYKIIRFNQPASSQNYGVNNINGFHVFADDYSFSTDNIENVAVYNEHVPQNSSYQSSCSSGSILINFKKKTLYNKNVNRYSNIEARQMGKKEYSVTTEGDNTSDCTLYFDNTEPQSAREVIEAFQKLIYLDN